MKLETTIEELTSGIEMVESSISEGWATLYGDKILGGLYYFVIPKKKKELTIAKCKIYLGNFPAFLDRESGEKFKFEDVDCVCRVIESDLQNNFPFGLYNLEFACGTEREGELKMLDGNMTLCFPSDPTDDEDCISVNLKFPEACDEIKLTKK